MKFLIALMCLFPLSAHASKIQDIEVIELVQEDPSEFQFKVRSRQSDPDAFFYIVFDKNDKSALDQLSYVLLKLTKQSQYKLDFDIVSFSPYPSGSYYKSSSIQFTIKP